MTSPGAGCISRFICSDLVGETSGRKRAMKHSNRPSYATHPIAALASFGTSSTPKSSSNMADQVSIGSPITSRTAVHESAVGSSSNWLYSAGVPMRRAPSGTLRPSGREVPGARSASARTAAAGGTASADTAVSTATVATTAATSCLAYWLPPHERVNSSVSLPSNAIGGFVPKPFSQPARSRVSDRPRDRP